MFSGGGAALTHQKLLGVRRTNFSACLTRQKTSAAWARFCFLWNAFRLLPTWSPNSELLGVGRRVTLRSVGFTDKGFDVLNVAGLLFADAAQLGAEPAQILGVVWN